MSDPTTPQEWQAAVDAADFLLLIDDAQRYGLIVSYQAINDERCLEIVQRGTEAGIFPTRPDRRRVWIGHWLTRQRRTLGVTQRVLAGHVGMSAPWISQVEGGATSISDRMIARLREAIAAIRKEKEKEQI